MTQIIARVSHLHTVDYEVAFVKGHAAVLERTQKSSKVTVLAAVK